MANPLRFEVPYIIVRCGTLKMNELNVDFDEMNIRDDDSFIEYDLDDYESDSVESEVDETILLFLEDHPLYNTHYVEFDKKQKDITVSNFVSGSLPRGDRGDKEYYCMTMLTLFVTSMLNLMHIHVIQCISRPSKPSKPSDPAFCI